MTERERMRRLRSRLDEDVKVAGLQLAKAGIKRGAQWLKAAPGEALGAVGKGTGAVVGAAGGAIKGGYKGLANTIGAPAAALTAVGGTTVGGAGLYAAAKGAKKGLDKGVTSHLPQQSYL